MKTSKQILKDLPIDHEDFDAQEALDWMNSEQLCMLNLSNETYELQSDIDHALLKSSINQNTLRKQIELYRQSVIRDLNRIWNT